MKKLFLFLCLVSSSILYAQDKIILKTGDTLSVIIAEQGKEQTSYVDYNDPELATTSIPNDRIAKIILNNGQVVGFKKSKYPGHYVGVYVGNAVPFSDFAHAEASDDRSGFARDKPFLSVEGRVRVFRFIGASASIAGGRFGVNSSPYFDYLNSQYNSTLSVYVNGELSDYRYASFSIGPDVGFNLGKRVKVFFPLHFSTLSIGTRNSDIIHYVEQSTGKTRTVERTSSGVGYGGSLGVKLDFVIAKHFGVGIAAQVNDYEVDMKVQEKYITQGTNIDYEWTQSVSYAYVGFNLHYHFK